MSTDDILLRSKLKLGKKLIEEKRFQEARTVYEQICARKKNDADNWFTLGVINGLLRQHDDAVKCCSKAVELAPHHAAAWYNLGIGLRDTSRTEQAAVALHKALSLNPKHAGAATSLGHVLIALYRYEEAEAVFLSVMDCQQSNPDFYAVYGAAMQTMGRYDAAISAYRKAIGQQHPRLAEVHENLAAALCMQGKYTESIEMYDAALALEPENARVHSSLLLTLHYFLGKDPVEMLESHKCWPGNAVSSKTPVFSVSPERPHRLRIGYVSADLRRHSVAYYIEPLLIHHDAARFEITCYYSHKESDATTARLKELAHRWRNVADMEDAQLLRMIADDEIDILVDLNGHTSRNRLAVFAMRAAPIQLSFIGYPNTTGLTEMDYRISDSIADPPGEESMCSETLFRLPDCFLCYQPPVNAPDVAAAPCEKNGFITFGSFNNLAKVNSNVISVWAKLLLDIPDSRLVLKNPSLTDMATRDRYQALFASFGISGDRIDLFGFIPDDGGHLGAYRRIDIALDTFPYNGTTTTCEALWMGVPVISLCGDRHSARVGASLLSTLGHPEWIADSPEQYQHIIKSFAQNQAYLIQLRSGLREQMRASKLCAAQDYVRAVESAYDEMSVTRRHVGDIATQI